VDQLTNQKDASAMAEPEANGHPQPRRRAAILYPAYHLALAIVIGAPAGFIAPDLPVRWQTPVIISAPLLALVVSESCWPRAITRHEQQLFLDGSDTAAPPTP
jgi:hypothetical protein